MIVIRTSAYNAGFEVLPALIMKSSVFLDITSCSPLAVNIRLSGIYHLRLQDRKTSQARNQREADSKIGGDMYLRSADCIFTGYAALEPRR
jgi:hypothetical protein